MSNDTQDKDLNLDVDDIDTENKDIEEGDDSLKDVKAEDIDKIDDAEKLKEIAKKSLEMKQKFYSRAKDTADKFKTYKQNNPPKKAEIQKQIKKETQNDDLDETRTRLEKLELVEKKRQFGYENNLSPEETDEIFKMTGNKPSKEDLKKPFIKGGLDMLRKERRLKENTPEPGNKFSAGGKSWQEMSPEEKRANFSEYVKARKRS